MFRVNVNLEVLRSCEAEARSPRSKLPINLLLTAILAAVVNMKVAKALNEATEVKKGYVYHIH